MASNESGGDRLVDAEAGAQILGLRANTLRKWARQGYVESVRVRGTVRFRIAALQAIITNGPKQKQGR